MLNRIVGRLALAAMANAKITGLEPAEWAGSAQSAAETIFVRLCRKGVGPFEERSNGRQWAARTEGVPR